MMKIFHSIKKNSEAATRGALCEKGVLRNFTKFTGKHLCQGLFFNKLQAKACRFIKKTLAQKFFCEFYEISKNTCFTELVWTTASRNY